MARFQNSLMVTLCLLVHCIVFESQCYSQDDSAKPTSGESQSGDEALKVFLNEVKEYKFVDSSTKKPLELQPRALLHWLNPARNGEDGALYVWTNEEVPIVVGTSFTFTVFQQARKKHAFHTVSEAGIVGTHREREIWSVPEARFEFKPMPGAPKPGETEAVRSQQLRNMARRFRVQAYPKSGMEQTRFVPQPLYRFENEKLGKSGAIFAYSIGTDPEALALFETRKSSDGSLAWHYGLARFTFYKLEAFLDDQPVWDAPQSESMEGSIFLRKDYQQLPYITFRAEHVIAE